MCASADSHDPSSDIGADADHRPLAYREIAADLRGRILNGEFGVTGRLPSETALAAEYGTSRARLRSALAQLARQSIVVSRPREGWQVHVAQRTQELDAMRSFAQWAISVGRSPGGAIEERWWGPADAREARLLGVRLGESLPRFTRVRTLDGRRVMVERSTWAPWVAHVIDELSPDVVSTTSALELAGITVTTGTHRLEAVAASSGDATLLGIRRSSPLLQVTRTTTSRGRIVELGVDRYRADAIAFEVEAGESVRKLV